MNFKPQIQTLENGLRLVTLNLPQMESVTALLVIKVGSRYESERVAGISHFLEHLVFKGTKKYPTAFDLASVVDGIGAEFNAFTAKEYTGFYVKAAASHLDLALDVLAQLVFQPLLPAKQMEKEKGVILEEINMIEDMPMTKVALDFESLIFTKRLNGQNDISLARPTIGDKKSIKGMKLPDFLAYRQAWYQPQRMVLGIVGGINRIKNYELRIMNSFFPSHLQHKRNTAVTSLCSLKPLKFKQTKPAFKLVSKKTEQTHFCLGFRAFERGHKDRYLLAVLATILGGNMSSRLFMEVREKRGLAYYIKTDLETYFDNGYLVNQAGVPVAKTEEAIKVILAECYKLKAKSKKLEEKELVRAKEYLKGKLALNLEDSQEIAGLFAEDLILEEKIRTPAQIIKEIDKVTLADIKRVAQLIFVSSGLNLSLIGPYKDEERFAKLLKI